MSGGMGIRSTPVASPLPAGAGAWLVAAAAIVFSTALYIGFPQDLGIKIGAMALVVAVAAAVVRFDITHPYIWFGGAFLLYSVSGPLLMHLGVHPYVNWGGWPVETLDFSGAMDMQFLGLATALLVIGPTRRPLGRAAAASELRPFFHGALAVCALGLLIGSVTVYEILFQGFTERAQYSATGGALSRFSFGFNILATALGVYLAKLFCEKRIGAATACALLVLLCGVFLVAAIGQRHFLFRSGIIMVFAWHLFYRPISTRTLVLLAFAALAAGSALSGYKMWLLTDSAGIPVDGLVGGLQEALALRDPALAQDPAWLRYVKLGLAAALGTEAMTPGNNMAMILSRVPHDLPFFRGETIPVDIGRAVLPGFLVATLLDSTGALYNELVFPENTAVGGGVGFSIVGYGYIHFGVPGVVLVMALLGAAIRWIYGWASRSAMGLLFFIGFLPVGVYVARNDVTAPLSQGLKHVLLPLVLMLIVAALLGQRGPAPDRRALANRRVTRSATARHPERERRTAGPERRARRDRRSGVRTHPGDRAEPGVKR